MILGGARDTKDFLKKSAKVDMGSKKQTRRLKHKRQKRHTRKRRIGGLNINNQFDDRRGDLINTLQDLIDNLQERINNGEEDIDEMEYIDQLQGHLMDEAVIIDTHYGNHDMEDIVNQRMQDVREILGLFNPEGNMNIENNASTIIFNNRTNRNNNTNNNNTNNAISIYNNNNNRKKLRKK